MTNTRDSIYNIPAGLPFAKILAQTLLDETSENKEQLGKILVLLPTRRACRILQESFLDLREHKALLLPRMQPIGDIDEEELSLSIMGKMATNQNLSIPPALPPLKRQILLSKLVQRLHPEQSQEHALKLAQGLGRLLDQIYTENLDIKNLQTLVPEEFAQHWQITIEFLEILSEFWPKILKERGVIDQADRRNRLILALAEFWDQHPPDHPVIGAGSTGSIPSTAKLLEVISALPEGRVILPGLDPDIDDESWNSLSETHPQFGLKKLLGQLNTERQSVKTLQTCEKSEQNTERQFLAREIMRPANTSENWAKIADDKNTTETLQNSLKNVSIIPCDHHRQEADTIALLMRETLETPGKKACLITPDRTLALNVTNACKRWGINIDDSAGQMLKHTSHGTFLQLSINAVLNDFSPLSLLALLKHSLCNLDMPRETYNENLRSLDYALRGLKPATGIEGLISHIQNQEFLDEQIKIQTAEFLDAIKNTFQPLIDQNKLVKQKTCNFTQCLKTHLELCEALVKTETKSAADVLWSGEIGRQASTFFAELFDHTHDLLINDFADYAKTLNHFMEQIQIRPAFGTHPNLQILGQLEARLINADIVILGGLNEGVWPPDPSADPWLSRPMRKDFGLPSPERSIGLAAHDFVQGLCTQNVILTRSAKADGTPKVPSRWLQRMDTVLQAANIDRPEKRDALEWAKKLDHAETITPTARPSPKPPIDIRPNRLSVTQVETWLRDPYSIYARHILKLKKLEDLEKPLDAAERGTVLHAVLNRFISETKDTLPENSAEKLISIAEDEIEKRHEASHIWSFWWPRFIQTAHWFVKHEHAWRRAAQNIATETKGELKLLNNAFTIVGVADRIDESQSGDGIIIDYKSGGTFSKKAMQNGELPQLLLEALMLKQGSFPGITPRETQSLQYWVLGGSGEGKITALDQNIEQLVEMTEQSLIQLIQTYDDPDMPYLSIPRPDQAPRFNDYEHLSRIREWGITGDNSENEAA